MAERYTADEVLGFLNDDFDGSDGEDSDFEGDGVYSYLSEAFGLITMEDQASSSCSAMASGDEDLVSSDHECQPGLQDQDKTTETPQNSIACSTASISSPVRDRSPVDSDVLADLSTDGDLGDDDEFDPQNYIACSTASISSPVRDRSPVDSDVLADLSTDGALGDDDEFDPTSSRHGVREFRNSTAIQVRGRGRRRMARGRGTGRMARGRGTGRMARGRGTGRMARGRGSRMARGRGSRMARGRGSRMARGRGSKMARGRGQTRGRGRGQTRGRSRGAVLPSISNNPKKSNFIGPLSYLDTIMSSPWKREEASSTTYSFSGPQPGPTRPVSNDKAIDLFLHFFTTEAFDLVVVETNRFAFQYRSQHMSPHSRPWHDVTRDELMAFIGMLFYMGIARLPKIELYWSSKHELIRQHVAEVMPILRFQQILRFLHLNNSEHQVGADQPGYDPVYKVRKLLDIVTPTFDSEFSLNESISVDEAMIPFKGRLSFKQYMKDKPVKHGIKVFVLADGKYGYIKKLQIYTGKNSILSQNEMGLSTKVVLDLMKGLENRHHRVFVDNYYTSPFLFLKLYLNGTSACGMARTNRKSYPAELTYKVSEATKLQRGFYDYRSNGPLLGCVWKDKKVINFLTTMHCAEADVSVTRTAHDGSEQEVSCPPCLPDYQEFMRGVDLSDQRISYYNVGRRSKKWWKRVFSYILEACSQNAYVLKIYGQANKKVKKPSFLDFRLELAAQLIGNYQGRSRIGRPRSQSPVDVRLDNNRQHLPIIADKHIECVVCNKIRNKAGVSRASLRHESQVNCSTCEVALCLNKNRNCYFKYHTQVIYWN